MDKDKGKNDQCVTLYEYLLAAWFILFMLFFALMIVWGGTASDGYHDETGYFLGGHGTFTETSPLRWYISYAAEIILKCTGAVGFAWGIFMELLGEENPCTSRLNHHNSNIKK